METSDALVEPDQSTGLLDGLPGTAYSFRVAVNGRTDFDYVSPACVDVYGFTAEEAMADPGLMHEAIHPLDRRSFDQAGQLALTLLETLRWDGRVVHTDGTVRLVSVVSRPQRLLDGDTLWHGLVVERLVAPTAGPAPDPGDDVRLGGDTLAILGHDIGTPLTAISSAADLAMEVLHSPPAPGDGRHEDLVRCLSTVQRNTARLELLRDGLLNRVSSDTGRLVATPAPVLLRPRLEAAVALSRSPSQVRVECAPGLTCWVQPSHLDQIVLNLLVNADKYAGGAVAVGATSRGDDVVLEIEDRGPGVPAGFRDQLFTRFTRSEVTADEPGTGLGLYIVHALAVANGGSASHASGPEGGSRFTVTLPGGTSR